MLLGLAAGAAGIYAAARLVSSQLHGVEANDPLIIGASVLREGATIAAIGVAVGGLSGLVLARIGTAVFGAVRMPGLAPAIGAALLLLVAATLASWMPAARASRVDVLQALRSD